MNELPRQILYEGTEAPRPDRTPLRAGPLTAIFEGGDLRYVRFGNREILRRVYVAIRDKDWGTILPRLTNLVIERSDRSFHIAFDCRNQQGEIDFFWKGSIVGAEDGTITCAMEGEALSTFLRNRIGWCVLHPIAECAGVGFVAEKDDGSIEVGQFPRFISPHQPVKDLRAISHEVVPGLWAEVRFAGDVFEMEDQRNWTDASFKTYSTPLSLPYPVEVTRATRVSQSITLLLRGKVAPPPDEPAPLTIVVEAQAASAFPTIGLGVASDGQALSDREIERLRDLRPAHLRVDLRLGDPGFPKDFRRAADEARALGASLEVALFLTDAADAELASLRGLVDEVRPTIARWLVFHEAEPSTSERWVHLARRHLAGYDSAAKIGAGTNRYFTELNRGRPPVVALDLVCYSLNPQVHAFDNWSLVEALQGQAETALSARQFSGDLPLAVTPVTLKSRLSPDGSGPARAPAPGALPSTVDPRQTSLFGAAWTVGSLKYLSESGVSSLTYYETAGWRGVMERETGSPLPELFRSLPGAVFPLYHVLADVNELAGAEVLAATSSDPLSIVGLALRQGERTRLLVANLTAEERSVRIDGLARPARLKYLDETNAARAMTSPASFRAEPGDPVSSPGGAIELALRPYAVARLDREG